MKKRGERSMLRNILTLVALLVVAVMFLYGFRETEAAVGETALEIKGMYGMEILFSDITDVTLLEQSMREIGVGTRTNGFGGLGETLKGHFSSDALGKHMLFVKAASAPTLRIRREGAVDVYLSFRDGAQTRDLYDTLMDILVP